MSSEATIKSLKSDSDGMTTYEYIVNHVDDCMSDMEKLVENLKRVDTTGQFVASTARYLSAIDREGFRVWINMLVEAAIEKDRERKYLGSLLEALWGGDYHERHEELSAADDNFRRVYKRLYGTNAHGI